MSDHKPNIGSIGWIDLTIPNAEGIRDFYQDVVGWKSSPVPMDGYNDYNMTEPQSGNAIAGICYSQGINTDLPPQWLMYIVVSDIDKSAAACTRLGGKILVPTKNMGSMGRYCVIQDPAGAVAALFQSAA